MAVVNLQRLPIIATEVGPVWEAPPTHTVVRLKDVIPQRVGVNMAIAMECGGIVCAVIRGIAIVLVIVPQDETV